MRYHLHHHEPADGARERFAGGNAVRDVLSGGFAPAGYAPATPAAAIAGPVGAGQATGGTVANTSGGSTSVLRVQVAIGVMFLLAIAALIALHKLGFSFSVTAG